MRPTSRTVPVSSNAELTVLLIGRRQVRVQVVKVAANESSWRNSISLRAKRNAPQKVPDASRTHWVPSHEAFSVNQMEPVSE